MILLDFLNRPLINLAIVAIFASFYTDKYDVNDKRFNLRSGPEIQTHQLLELHELP